MSDGVRWLAQAVIDNDGVISRYGTIQVKDKAGHTPDWRTTTELYSPLLSENYSKGEHQARISQGRVEIVDRVGNVAARLSEADLELVHEKLDEAEVLIGGYVYRPIKRDKILDLNYRTAIVGTVSGIEPPFGDSQHFARIDSNFAGKLRVVVLYLDDYKKAAVFSLSGLPIKCTMEKPLERRHKSRPTKML